MTQKSNLGRPPLPPSERADSQIQLRVTRQRKAAYVRAANRKKQTLAAWCFENLDREAIMPPK
jgi:predicted HicB family RNase H-like nuclease